MTNVSLQENNKSKYSAYSKPSQIEEGSTAQLRRFVRSVEQESTKIVALSTAVELRNAPVAVPFDPAAGSI